MSLSFHNNHLFYGDPGKKPDKEQFSTGDKADPEQPAFFRIAPKETVIIDALGGGVKEKPLFHESFWFPSQVNEKTIGSAKENFILIR